MRLETLCNKARLFDFTVLSCCVLLLGGCSGARSWQQPDSDALYSPATRSVSPAVNIALDMVGRPYRYGAEGPGSFDCSGLVWYSYGQVGYRVPRTSVALYQASQKISLTAAQPGDLLFFGSGQSVSHVAIYMGDRTFVHAPSSGKTVSVGHLSNPWYRENFISAGRLVSQ